MIVAASGQDVPLKVERIGDFQLLTLNQPEQRNPLGPEVVAALGEALGVAGGLSLLLDDAARDFAAQMRGEGGEGVRAARARRDPAWKTDFDATALADW